MIHNGIIKNKVDNLIGGGGGAVVPPPGSTENLLLFIPMGFTMHVLFMWANLECCLHSE